MKNFLKKTMSWLLIIVIAVSVINFYPLTIEAAGSEMNIYAMYLKSSQKGDSVLMESKGEYLLIDIGTASHANAIISQLKSLNAKSVDIYFSHLHGDHVGGGDGNILEGIEKISASGIKINKLYMPDKELAPESKDYPQKYARFESFMKNVGEIVYLKVGDTLKVGDVSGKVIGPVNVNKMHPNDYKGKGDSEDAKYTYYENNCSLVTIFTCGNTKYFTAGDCLIDEADFLVKKYGNSLNADIMKMSHHGTGSGNSESLLNAISPSYAFAPNTGTEAKIASDTKKWKTNVYRKNVIEHGMCYLVGNEKKTIIYQVKNDVIKMYRGSISSGNMLKGWIKLAGADGQYRKIDMYYLNSNGVPLKGVQKIGGNYYNFGNGGCMEYGNYNSKGKYQGWKSYGKEKRYYTFSSDKQRAVMSVGFKKVGSSLYYFDKNGYKLEGKKKTELKKIGKYYYAVGKSGAISVNKWTTIGSSKYYFDKKGRMITNKKIKVKGNYYYFGKNGKMVRNKKVKIGKYSYYFGKSGAMYKNRTVTIKGKKYYCQSDGRMKANK